MRSALTALTALYFSFLLPAGVGTAQPPAPMPQAPVDPAQREEQLLMDRLGQLSEAINKNPQAADAWRHQMAQAEITWQIAARCKIKERDGWLKVTVDSYYSAAVQGPAGETAAYQKLAQLPAQIAQAYPDSPVRPYAALQEIQAEYVRELARAGENSQKVQDNHRHRLVKFAADHPKAAEASAALVEAGQVSELLGQKDDARRCYRYAIEHHPGQPATKKAWAALWKMGMVGESPEMKLPLLYAEDQSGHSFELKELRGMVAVVYFWSSASGGADQDFHALKAMTEKHQRGVEVVYVNMDATKAKAREFLTGRLTTGTHVYLPKGLESPLAERLGITSLPVAFVIDADGKIVQSSLPASAIEPVVAAQLKNNR